MLWLERFNVRSKSLVFLNLYQSFKHCYIEIGSPIVQYNSLKGSLFSQAFFSNMYENIS